MLGDPASAVMFAHDKSWRGCPEEVEHGVELRILIWRVDVAEVRGGRVLSRSAQPPPDIRPDDAAAVAAAEAVGGLRDEAKGVAMPFDEGYGRGTSRQRLEPDRARAGVEVEHPNTDDSRSKDVEERLPHQRTGRAHLQPGGRVDHPAPPLPRRDPRLRHQPLISRCRRRRRTRSTLRPVAATP